MKKRTFLAILALSPLLAASEVVEVYDVDGLVSALQPRNPDAEPLEIVVAPGEYSLTTPLSIYPDTTLTLSEDTVIIADFGSGAGNPILNGRHYDEYGYVCPVDEYCTHGGYGQTHDVVVQGGVWDRNSPSDTVTSVFSFRHASGIVVRDAAVLHCSGHYFNVSGSQNVTISNVVFSSPVAYTATDKSFWGSFAVGDPLRYQTIEAIHTDFINAAGEPAIYPQDGTGCRNVVVEDCLFDGVFSGVGTHHLNAEAQGAGICVADCVFTNLLSWAVFAFSLDSVQMTNCLVFGGAGLITARDSDVVLSDNYCANATDHAARIEDSSLDACRNSISDCALHAFQIVSCSALLEDNFIDAPDNVGIRISGNSNVQANRNRILDAGLHAISIAEGSVLSATGNTIERPQNCAVIVNAAMVQKLSGNVLKGSGASAVAVMAGSTVSMSGNNIASTASHGIVVTGNSTLTASGNTVSDAGANGFNISASTAKLVKNTILRPKSAGIRGADASKVVADSNTIKTAGSYGILMTGKAKLTAKNNTIDSSGSHGVMIDSCEPCSITGNKVVSSASCGIRIVKTKGCTVSSNTISKTGSKSDGIVFDGCATGTISGNKVSGTSGHGIRVVGSKSTPATVKIQNNTVSSGGTAAGYADIRLGDYSRNCTVTGNSLVHKKFTSSKTGTTGTNYKPSGTSLSSVVRKSATALSAGWARRDYVDGYEVQYADNASFKSAKTKRISGAKTVSATIKSLASGKRYWVRVRTFDKVTGTVAYSGWTSAMPALHGWSSGSFFGYAVFDKVPYTVKATVAASGKITGTLERNGVSSSFSSSGYSSYIPKKSQYKTTIAIRVGGKTKKCAFTVAPISGNSAIGRMQATGTGFKADLSKAGSFFASPLKKLAKTSKSFTNTYSNSGLANGQTLKITYGTSDAATVAISSDAKGTFTLAPRVSFYKVAKSGSNTLYYGYIPVISPKAGVQRLLKFTITRKSSGACSAQYAFAAF